MANEQKVKTGNQPKEKTELNKEQKSQKVATKEKTKLEKQKKDKKPKKEKKGLFKKLRESWGELKKTTWPNFPTVVKKTGVVILVTILFTLVLFGIDFGLGKLYNLLIG